MRTKLTVDNTLMRIEEMLDTLRNASSDDERAEIRRNAETSAKLLKLVVQEHANIVRADTLLGRQTNTEEIVGYGSTKTVSG